MQRSGSWMLAESLERSGIAGRPREYFLEAFEAECREKWGVSSYAEYLTKVLEFGTTRNGVFGVKFHWYQFEQVAAKLGQIPGCQGLGAHALLSRLLPGLRYIWLTRRDKARQAISHYKAIRTGQWWKIDGYRPAGDPLHVSDATPPRAVDFDFGAIHRLEKMALNHEEKWQRYFSDSHIEPLVVAYEDLARSFVPEITRILRFLEVPKPKHLRLTTRLRQQADGVSEEWLHRYVSTRGDAAPLAAAAPEQVSPVAFNGREVRIAAMQRSGHHGIIFWIAGQSRGTVLFLNDAEPGTSPFLTCSSSSRLDQPAAKRTGKRFMQPFVAGDSLIYNYEDRELRDIFSEDFEAQHDALVGTSGARFDLVVVRDPFNMFASRMSAGWVRHKLIDPSGRTATVALWKSYARECLGETSFARNNKVVVNYNRWCSDREYRRETAGRLGLDFTDAGFSTIAPQYGGSSFDGLRFRDEADRMKVLERWKSFESDWAFRELFKDQELIELSEELFGPLPGTSELLGVEE